MRLYDLTEQYQDVLELLQDESDSEHLQAMLDGLEGRIEEKVENTIKVAKTLEGKSKVIADEIKRLQERKSSIDNNRNQLLNHSEQLLTGAGLEKLQGTLFNVWMQNNPPSVVVTDESLIPKHFYKASEPVLQKREIMDAIKSGKEVPGAEITQSKGMRVR